MKHKDLQFENTVIFEFLGGNYKPYWIDDNSCNPGMPIDIFIEENVIQGKIPLNSKYKMTINVKLERLERRNK